MRTQDEEIVPQYRGADISVGQGKQARLRDEVSRLAGADGRGQECPRSYSTETTGAMPTCGVAELGRVEYCEAEGLQLELVRARREGEVPDLLLLLEHDPVVTVGRGTEDVGQVVDLAALRREGIPMRETSRGGQVTYHGPGQIVGYPIVDLQALKPDLHGYLRSLEQVLIDSLAEFGYEAERVEGLTGVWMGKRKVASIGVAVRRWVTYHGFALNVTCHSPAWSLMEPCGLSTEQVASLDDFGSPPPVPGLHSAIIEQFGAVFRRRPVRVAPEELLARAVF